MSSRAEREHERHRAVQEKCVVILNDLLRDEDNKYCADCDSKGPRWASWNLGVFLCIRCAGIHRNLGVHLSRVKSVNLDTWTPEQVASLQQMGNSKGRAVYEARLPDGYRRPQADSPLEAFIRAKYEHKKYIAKEWVPPTSPPKAAWADELLSSASSPISSAKKKNENEDSPRVKAMAKELPINVVEPMKQQPSIPKSQSLIDDLLSLDLPPVQAPAVQVTKPSSGVDALDLFSSINTGNAPASSISDHFDGLTSLPSLPVSTSSSSLPTSASSPAPVGAKMSKESILALYQTAPAAPGFPLQGFPSGAFPTASPAQATPAPALGVANGFTPQQPAYSQSLIDQMKKMGMQPPPPIAPAMIPVAPLLVQPGPTVPGPTVKQAFGQPQPGFVNPWDMPRPTGPSSLPSALPAQGMFGVPAPTGPSYGQTVPKSLWQ